VLNFLFAAKMKKKVFIKRIFHREKWRLAIIFDYDEKINSIIRTIKNINYSKTHSCWYTDDNEETLRQIFQIFKDKAEVDISAISTKSSFSGTEPLAGNDQSFSALPGTDKEIIISREEALAPGLDPDKSGSDDIVRLPRTEIEIIPDTGETSESHLIPDQKRIETTVNRPRLGPVEFRINENDSRLSIRFIGYYNKEWIDEIRTYGKSYYDKVHREFLLPWSKLTVDSLSDYFASVGVEVRVVRPVVSDELKASRKEIGDEVRARELGEKAYEGLELVLSHLNEVRYSNKTNEAYLSLLELFFKYYNEKDPEEITLEEVSAFLNDYVVKFGFSASYQNQMVSAIKNYYEIMGKGRIKPEMLDRPRRSRALPKVFSKEEVKKILNSTRNIKHKLLLWLIYSCGLRRSEVTNIMITDLDRDRKILHIREGKGRVDRIVPVSDKVWEKLDEYVDSFYPKKYLFEGQHGGRYSVESVYNVFKQALKKAGIMKEVGVHSLRHSYATHLHESGLDIRYIQELLGHKSTRTTEIYTHVSRRNLVSVRSPIEDLDVK
jgi:integrase/recombinase XerD